MFESFGKIRVDLMKKMVCSYAPEDKVICDLGAGKSAISDRVRCLKRIKIDIDPNTNPDIVFDLTKGIPLSDNSVDIAIAAEIFEHIYCSKKFMNEIKRILRKSGYLILSCPNICSLKYRFAFLIGKIPAHAAKSDMSYDDERPGHVRDYTFDEMYKLLKMFNFQIIESKTDGISFKGKSIIPAGIIRKTFGDSIIICARVEK